MLRKQSENSSLFDSILNSKGKTNYRKEVAEREPEMKKDRVVEAKKHETADPSEIMRGSSSIRSARCDVGSGLREAGGPNKHVGVTGKNSIWDSEVLSRRAADISPSEKTAQEKQSASRLREMKQAEYKQSVGPQVGNDEPLPSRGSSVSGQAVGVSNHGWVPAHKHSIFDTNDNFDRLAALNARVNPKVEPVKLTKKASAPISKSFSSQDATNRFVDGILDVKKETEYRSVHNSAVDRLFNVLKAKSQKE